jgi:hypothetical protein
MDTKRPIRAREALRAAVSFAPSDKVGSRIDFAAPRAVSSTSAATGATRNIRSAAAKQETIRMDAKYVNRSRDGSGDDPFAAR